MFVLRKITEEKLQSNTSLGESYTLIRKDDNPKEFKEMSLNVWNEAEPKNTFAFVLDVNGKPYGLFKNQFNYIMASNGQTFSYIKS